MNRLTGKVAIITGGSQGIGRACAIRMAEEGAAVAVFDVLDTAGEALVAELIGRGFPTRSSIWPMRSEHRLKPSSFGAYRWGFRSRGWSRASFLRVSRSAQCSP